MQSKILLTYVIGLSLVVPAAFAANESDDGFVEPSIQQPVAQPQLQWKKQFDSLDVNKDGMIDSKEAAADKHLNKQFKTIAKKGKLDQSGYMNWQKTQQPRG